MYLKKNYSFFLVEFSSKPSEWGGGRMTLSDTLGFSNILCLKQEAVAADLNLPSQEQRHQVSLINVLKSNNIYDRPLLWLIHSGTIRGALASEVYLT